MAKHVDNEVRKITKIIVQNIKFVSFSSHEITSIYNASWATYWWLNYARSMSNTFDVECATKKFWICNQQSNFVNHDFFTMGFEGRGACFKGSLFDVDGVKTFQGLKSKVTTQIQYQYSSFITSVHYMIH